MLRRLLSLFRPTPAPVVHHEGVYRPSPKAEPKPERLSDGTLKPVTHLPETTLFARPAPPVVVPPTTEADHYRWLDDGDLPLSATVAPPPAPVEPDPEPTFNVSGSYMTFVTGVCAVPVNWARNVCVTGRIW